MACEHTPRRVRCAFVRPFAAGLSAAGLFTLLAAPALAGDAAPPRSAQETRAILTEALLAMMGDHGGGAETPELPPIEQAVKGFEVVNNNLNKNEATFFTLYRKDDRLLAAIPTKMLDEPWLLAGTFSAGPYLTGFQLGGTLVEWRRRDNTLQLIEPELRYTASKGGANAENIRRTYTDRYVFTTPIIGASDDAVLIDLGATLLGNSTTLLGMIGAVNPTTARVERAKAFANNVEVAFSAAHTFWLFEGSLVTLHISLSALPDPSGFEMRKADHRVGYWVHAIKDFSQRDPLRPKFVRTIERWDLKKADPSRKLSPPEEPIVFYIEKSVPLEHRRAVRQGIEAWNEAFRKVGIDNAIEVRQQTDTQYADIDPEDVRYNFIRWITTEGGFAIALHRVDPRTGQILDADILIDDSWIDIWVNEYPLMIERAWRQRLDARLREHPEMAPVLDSMRERAASLGIRPLDLDNAESQRAAHRLTSSERRALAERLLTESDPGVLGRRDRARIRCTFASRLGHNISIAHLAHISCAEHAGDPTLNGSPERLIHENLVTLTAHEVGHILGLRHNFTASAWQPVEAIDTYTDPAQEPPVASVMDYVGAFIAEPGNEQGLYNMQRVGVYDRWAIEYGYAHAESDEELDAILTRSIEPGHRFLTDEDIYSPDPTAMTYDLGSDPVTGRLRQLERTDRIRATLVDRFAKEGESFARVRIAFQRLWIEDLFSLWDSTPWVGGTYRHRDHNIPGARVPLENVEPEHQRAVLAMLEDRVLSPHAFNYDRDLLRRLQLEKWYMPAFNIEGAWGGGDYDLHNATSLVQYFILSDLLFWCAPRMIIQEVRADPTSDALTAPELFRRITDAVWSEFAGAPDAGPWTNLEPKVGALRRNLQREHAEALIDLAARMRSFGAVPRQLQTLATHELRRIDNALAGWLADRDAMDRLDDYSRIHVEELRRRVNSTLEAQVTRLP